MSVENHRIDVVVVGAAGQTGRAIVRALSRRGARVRAVVHRLQQAELVPDAMEVEAARLDNVAGLTSVMKNASVAYYIPPVFHAREEKFGANIIQAAVAAKLRRLVYHSVMHAPTPSMPHHLRKAGVELRLRESSLRWTIMQPAMYSQTPLAFLNSDRTQLRVGFDPRQQFTPADLEDLAEAVAVVLLDSRHEYATYELAGAQCLTFLDMANAMSRVLRHEVMVRRMPSALVASAAATRLGPNALFPLKAMLDHYGAHGFIGNSRVLRMLLARDPLTFSETIRRELQGCVAQPSTTQLSTV